MTLRRPVLTATLAAAFFGLSLTVTVAEAMPWGRVGTQLQASLLGRELAPVSGVVLNAVPAVEKEGTWTYCDYTVPADAVYQAELEAITVDAGIQPGATFLVDLRFKNTGTTRLFSAKSDCPDVPVLNLGTQKQMDRESLFGLEDRRVSGWVAANRVQMEEPYADPGESFNMTFQSIAPEGDNLYREFFQPVVEGQAWIGEPVAVDIPVGNVTDAMTSLMDFVVDESRGVADLVDQDRNILMDLSEQKMYVRAGETTLWTLTVSSGAADTPTPAGSYKILSKQELRVGGKAPHYRMPYFQMWDRRGYGIHALPYLESDGGVFWSEAFNHIGRAVSHGCIRTLPKDAAKVYTFTDIGTPVVVQK